MLTHPLIRSDGRRGAAGNPVPADRVAALADRTGAVSAGPETAPMGRRRRGRDPVPRRVVQKVRLSEAEHRELRARATALGVSVPRLMVEAALDGRETPTERRNELAALFEIRRVLATVANNVNQLARSANISGQLTEQSRLERTLGEVDELLGQLRGVAGRL